MELLETLWQLVLVLLTLVREVAELALRWGLVIAWIAWWLWGVNWKNAWARLREGAWAPLVLLMVLVALVWSRISPGDLHFLGLLTIPSFWAQLTMVGFWVGVAFFCGWLQGVFGWEPAEVNLEPPAVAHGAHHAHH